MIELALSAVLKKASRMCCDAYQSETGRVLDTSVEVHIAGKRNKAYYITPLAKHRREARSGGDFNVECTVLYREDEIGIRKAHLWIHITKFNRERIYLHFR